MINEHLVAFLQTLRYYFIKSVDDINMIIAKLLGYPRNPGMPIAAPHEWGWNNISDATRYHRQLPMHEVPFPPRGEVTTFYDIVFKPLPEVAFLHKTYYESEATGYYSYFLDHFKNSIFLPDWLSEYLQIDLGYHLDSVKLEYGKQTLFFILIFYMVLIQFRALVYWFLELNPYYGLLYFPCAMVDWFEELFGGYIPNLFGVNMALTLFNMIVGKVTDLLNHLAFTMPYLPSEATKERLFINGEFKYVLNFKYLPYLWYKHPIPNDIRQYWVLERPDILTYMQKSYARLDIDFLPDAVLKYATDNPELNILSTPFNSLPSQLIEQLKTLAFIGSRLEEELLEQQRLIEMEKEFEALQDSLDLEKILDLSDFFHYLTDLF